MIKVITYGTYDLLHYGHIRLLERAKALGDYLIVGITADDFDKARGKINVQQSLMERIEAVKATGLADEIIIEEYEGQKIDDIRRYNIDIFTVGSDWIGKFDYLNEYCKVIYLDRTKGISSSDVRAEQRKIRLGLLGEERNLVKVIRESQFVNGIEVFGVCTKLDCLAEPAVKNLPFVTDDYIALLKEVDAVYIVSHPTQHYKEIKMALDMGKHVLCESPIVLNEEEYLELSDLAVKKNCILMEAIKTAYSTAYSRLILLAKSGIIGKVVSIDATCTSLQLFDDFKQLKNTWNSICAWGPTALLPVFQILGVDYRHKNIVSSFIDKKSKFDSFTKIDFVYPNAVACIKVGKGVKSEGEMVISGTKGYIYVPAPWWKTDYFEIRYENMEKNKRYFYQLDGEGIRYEIVAFLNAIKTGETNNRYINRNVSKRICSIMNDFYVGTDMETIENE